MELGHLLLNPQVQSICFFFNKYLKFKKKYIYKENSSIYKHLGFGPEIG